MIITLDKQNEERCLPLVDFHTHIGRIKIETTKGSSQRVNMPKNIIQLYEKLQYEIHKRITQNPTDYYVSLPPADELSKPMYPFLKQLFDSNDKKSRGWIVDHIICFPFNDIFHQKTDPKFVKSNQFVRHQLNTFDNSFRFIPFCRCDVTDEGAEKEVKNSINSGMRGLKLHPLSQGWIDRIISDQCKRVLKTAADLLVPIIFDVPNKGVAIDITNVSEEARSEFSKPIKVVLGHNAFDYSSKEIFDCINTNDMYTETSGMRGKDVEIFFSNVMEIEGWENKILFGTDSNYFGVLQAADFITFLFSNKFLDLLADKKSTVDPLTAASKILGRNALRIIPNSWKMNIKETENQTMNSSKKLKQTKLKGDIPAFVKSLKKFLTQQNNFSEINITENTLIDGKIQVLTLGNLSNNKSYIISLDKKFQKLTLFPSLNNLKSDSKFELDDILKIKQVFKLKQKGRSQSLSENSFSEIW